jgi:SAM-dependent methyltransferase
MLERVLNQSPAQVVRTQYREIPCFSIGEENLDRATVASFGEEWKKFHDFAEADLRDFGEKYFSLLSKVILPENPLVADLGCGSGRWSKYFAPRAGHIIAVDPSEAIFAADVLLADTPNVSLVKASIDALPFADETFDFAFSLGVLHHIPDTAKAMRDCVKKVKIGGYFLVYLYYNLDNRAWPYRALFSLVNGLRSLISRFPQGLKKLACDLLALLVYWPLVSLTRLLKTLGVPKELRAKLPLHAYENSSFYILRNDALDRFGTPIEQRFSRSEIEAMMQAAGLNEIRFAEHLPYWCAIGRKFF